MSLAAACVLRVSRMLATLRSLCPHRGAPRPGCSEHLARLAASKPSPTPPRACVCVSLELPRRSQKRPPAGLLPNPQTDELLSLLELDHVVTVPCPGSSTRQGGGNEAEGAEGIRGAGAAGEGAGAGGEAPPDPCEIDLDEAGDPNEIQLDEG